MFASKGTEATPALVSVMLPVGKLTARGADLHAVDLKLRRARVGQLRERPIRSRSSIGPM